MPTTTDRLTEIAGQYLRIETLEERHSDRLDFYPVSVWSVKNALQAAYAVGLEYGRRPMENLLLEALEQVRDHLQDILDAAATDTPYTHAEVLTWLGELRETAAKVLAEATGHDR